MQHWFVADKKGLAQLVARRGKSFIVAELLQNAWDQQITRVDVSIKRASGSRYALLVVEDDNPDGFADIRHAFTLFAESAKKADPKKRGRFNLGEKLVLALCEEASIVSTRAGVGFDRDGRHALRARRETGTRFEGRLPLTYEDIAECLALAKSLIPPPGIVTTVNGESLQTRTKVREFAASLPTEIADDDGVLRRTQRMTQVHVYEPLPGVPARIYELGIPVVETGDRWDLDIQQKVPLNFERDNVSPAYLRTLRVQTLNALADDLCPDDATSAWVKEAASDPRVEDVAVSRVAQLRFGDRRVAYDPSDQEANKLAVSRGYVVVHGGQLSKMEWTNLRRANALPPAGQVTPSPKPYSPDGPPLRLLDRASWTVGMTLVAGYAQYLAREILGCQIAVQIADNPGWPFAATYGPHSLVLNAGCLGSEWFDAGACPKVTELLIHELGHHATPDHLSSEYHEALCRIGAQAMRLALEFPGAIRRFQASTPSSSLEMHT